MVRKRDAYTRARDSLRQRRKTRPPKTGWLISELAALTGRPARTIRFYVEQGLLERPPFYGTATRYGRPHLLRLLGIERLKREGLRSLPLIKQRLDAAGEAELLAAVAARPPSAAVAVALGLADPNASSASNPREGALPIARGAEANASVAPGELWRRILLLPGLELLLADDASPAVRHVAMQVQAHCRGR